LTDARLIGAHAVERLIHHLSAATLQNHKSEPIAVRHFGGPLKTEGIP